MDRRRYLAVVGAALLAGCQSGGDESGGDESSSTSTETPTATATTTATPTETATETATEAETATPTATETASQAAQRRIGQARGRIQSAHQQYLSFADGPDVEYVLPGDDFSATGISAALETALDRLERARNASPDDEQRQAIADLESVAQWLDLMAELQAAMDELAVAVAAEDVPDVRSAARDVDSAMLSADPSPQLPPFDRVDVGPDRAVAAAKHDQLTGAGRALRTLAEAARLAIDGQAALDEAEGHYAAERWDEAESTAQQAMESLDAAWTAAQTSDAPEPALDVARSFVDQVRDLDDRAETIYYDSRNRE